MQVFCVQLSRPDKVCFTGYPVTGYVLLQVAQDEEVRGIKLRLHGDEMVRLERMETIHPPRDPNAPPNAPPPPPVTELRVYEQNVDVINTGEYYIFGGPNQRVILQGGRRYAFQFAIPLPLNCTSSFYMANGHQQISKCGYMIHASVDRPWKFDYNCYEYPQIVQLVDCGRPDLVPPRQMQDFHTVCCWPCSQGDVNVTLSTAHGAYVAGESIAVGVRIINATQRQTPNITLTLHKKITVRAMSVVETNQMELDRRVFPIQQPQGPFDTEFPCNVIVPLNVGHTTMNGKLIDVEFWIHVEVFITGNCVGNVHINLPTIIGNVPRPNEQPPGQQMAVQVPQSPPKEELKETEHKEAEYWPDQAPPAYNDAMNVNAADAVKNRPVAQGMDMTLQRQN
jgi:hypothetical protein